MKKVVIWACIITGGIASAGLYVAKVALKAPDVKSAISQPLAIPEPSSLYLLALGVAVWFSLRRNQRRL